MQRSGFRQPTRVDRTRHEATDPIRGNLPHRPEPRWVHSKGFSARQGRGILDTRSQMNDSALHDHVLARRDIIVETFRRELGRQSQAAGQLAPSLLIGTLPEFFDQLAVELRAGAGASLAEFALPAAGAHGRTRWAQGFDLREVVREYGVLHHVILRDIFEQGVKPSLGALQALQNAINMGIADAVVGFTDQTLRLQETLHAKELELESHQLRLRMVTRHVPLVLWTARPDGSIDWYNDHWFEYTGQSAITSGSEWLDAAHPDDRNPTSTAWNGSGGCAVRGRVSTSPPNR